MDLSHVSQFERGWQPHLRELNALDAEWSMRADFLRAAEDPRWELFAALSARRGLNWLAAAFNRPPSIALRLQGLLGIQADYPSRLELGLDILYVDALAVAPWNRSAARPFRELKGVGSLLVERAIRRSVALGYDGRIGLHSLEDPETHRFYREGLEMTELGRDALAENQLYFEYSAKDAHAFLKQQDSRARTKR